MLPVSARWHHARAAAHSLGWRADITKLINAFFFFSSPLETSRKRANHYFVDFNDLV